jgi:hypothetical protein
MKRIDSLVRSFLVGAGILLLAGFAVPSVSQAATITFNLTSDHCTGGCLTGQTSGGTITLTDVATGGVDISIVLANGNKMVSTGFDADFGFNLIGNPSVNFTNLSNLALISANPQTAGALHMDGTGFFEYGLNCAGCGNGGSAPVAGPFAVHVSGITTASFEANAIGQYFAVDLISGTTGNTGAVDASVPNTPVPEPSTVVLYGLGLAMLIVGQKLRKSREISANLN